MRRRPPGHSRDGCPARRGAHPCQALRRARRGRPRRPDRRAGRRLRLSRAERRRQDDLAADAARPHPSERGTRRALRPRPTRPRRESTRGRRRLRRRTGVLSVPECAPKPRAARRLRRRPAQPHRRGARAGRAARPRRRSRRRLLARDEAAARDRGIAPAGAAAAPARRADDRTRPGRDARHAPARPPTRERGDHDPALEPSALRGGGSLQPGCDRAAWAGRLRRLARRAEGERGYELPPSRRRPRDRAARRADCQRHRRRRRRRRRASLQRGRRRRGDADCRARAGRGRLHCARTAGRQPRGAVSRPDRGRTAAARAGGRVMAAVYRWELRKLRAQKRTYLGLVGAMLVPIAFVVALAAQNGAGPSDVPLGRGPRETGLAVPFVVLFFMSIWGLPLVTALVAGDIVASESHNGTLKTILTRSRERGQVFAGNTCAAATYTLLALFAMVAVGVTAGVIEFGWHPLTSLSGTKVAPGTGLGLLALSTAVYAWPLLAIAAFGLMLSTVTRNSAASVVGPP